MGEKEEARGQRKEEETETGEQSICMTILMTPTALPPSCQVLTEEELEELSRDARLLKKFKSGKISEAELDRQLQLSSGHS